jgi:alpha-D-ribose 1-methylphosphonate 5-triphosphate synthase subunit PhnG
MMKRKQRTEILINGTPGMAAELANEITSQYDVRTLEEPHQGLVMIKVRESAQKSLFYLGEMLVTECKVRIGSTVGLGIIKGAEPELAYQLAVIDAAYEAGLPEVDAWSPRLLEEADRIQAGRQAHAAGVLRTKVHFETMDTD